MGESDEPAASKPDESMEPVEEFPHLARVGVKIDIDSLRKALSTGDLSPVVPRFPPEVTVTNGMIADALTILHRAGPGLQNLSTETLFSFFCHLLPDHLDSLGTSRNFKTNKVIPFRKQLAGLQKNRKAYPEKLSAFLDDAFVQPKHQYDLMTPRRKYLKKENMTLRELSSMQAEESERKDIELSITREALTQLEEDLHQSEEKRELSEQTKTPLLKKIAGFQSGASRRRKPPAKSSTPAPEAFEGKDIIVVESRTDNIITGMKYHVEDGERKSTGGHMNHYIVVDSASKPCSSTTTSATIHSRAKQLDAAAMLMAGGTVEDKALLYTELVRSNKELFDTVLQNAGFTLLTKMQPAQAVHLQSLLRLSTYAFRNLRRALTNIGKNILPSEGDMDKVRKTMVTHVGKENVESGLMGLYKSVKDEEPKECAFVRVKSLSKFISTISETDPAGYRFDEGFDGKWWILFSGDKGGDHMKFHVEIINSQKAGSVDNVHVYCMYEASDSPGNMRKMWNIYKQQVRDMYEPSFKLHGREVVIFLGGDYHFLDDMVGHQGSSATYPSHLDYVTLKHLQEHGGKPHTPEKCSSEIPLRTAKEYQSYYDQNLCDDRRGGEMNLTGKHHYSIAAPMIFPVANLANVVPPVLHILLGIVLVIYNLLLKTCKALDEATVNEEFLEEKQRLANVYEELSLEADEIDKSLRAHGADVITITNRAHRLKAVMSGDNVENETIAKSAVTDQRFKPVKRSEIEKCKIGIECEEEWCIVTQYDVNLTMIQCDTCDHWFHAMCEGIRPSAEASLSDLDYHCRNCTSVAEDGCNVDRLSDFEEIISEVIAEEDVLNTKLINIEIEVDGMKAKYSKYSGPRETALEAALAKMKVQRQAYHSNVIVGNHCRIVLERHEELTEIIKDQPNYTHFNEVFKIFNDSMKFIMARRFLEAWEIDELESLCVKLGEVFPLHFPDRSLTRKIHEHIMNVPRFVRHHGTIGLLSEQEGESKHASFKAELRSLASVRDQADRIRLALEREELRSASDKELIKPKVRLCQKCRPERVFLRAGKDKKKHCKVCEPSFFNH